MLQLLHMDVAKVNRDVSHVAYLQVFSEVCCKRLLKMFHLFRMYVTASVLFGCCICLHTYCKCFIWMLHIFHTHVASVLSRCCTYFHTYVATLCFKCFICVKRMLHPNVHVTSVSWGHGPTVARPVGQASGVASLGTRV
jgi:hypothetical protein